jgi:hypothetical protein
VEKIAEKMFLFVQAAVGAVIGALVFTAGGLYAIEQASVQGAAADTVLATLTGTGMLLGAMGAVVATT